VLYKKSQPPWFSFLQFSLSRSMMTAIFLESFVLFDTHEPFGNKILEKIKPYGLHKCFSFLQFSHPRSMLRPYGKLAKEG
jgi:hypothetical protein